MAIRIEETFRLAAPAESVWRFLLDPARVVTCLPGAELEKVVDERTFEGAVKVKLGAVGTRYRGRVRLVEVDEAARSVRMQAEGRETGGGTASGLLTSRVRELPGGDTEVMATAEVDLTGRVVQVGRGMIQGVAKELFGEFARRVRAELEAPAGAPRAATAVAAGDDSIPLLRILLRAAWAPIARLLARLFRRASTSREARP